jgi:HPt (histidine-containing phosphotransfer) domain-containing protein
MMTSNQPANADRAIESGTYVIPSRTASLLRSGALSGSPGETPDAWADPLDRRVFGALVELSAEVPGFLAELSEEFQKGVGGQVAALRDAFRDGNTQALTFAAHSLRGCCGTIGANGMAALARSLEDAPPADPATGWPLIQRLEAEYEAVRRALEQYVPGAPTAHAHAGGAAA